MRIIVFVREEKRWKVYRNENNIGYFDFISISTKKGSISPKRERDNS